MRYPLTLAAILGVSTIAALPASAESCGHHGHTSHHHHNAPIYVQPNMKPDHSHVNIINAPHHGARPASAENSVRVFRPAPVIDSRAAAIQARLNARAQRAAVKANARAAALAQARLEAETALRLARIEANQEIIIEQNARKLRRNRRNHYRNNRYYGNYR